MGPAYSLALQTTYQDLVESSLALTVADIEGQPVLRKRGRRAYWYDRYRVGTEIRQRYIAEDSAETRARLSRAETLRSNRAAVEKRCAGMVAILRSGRYPTLDQQTGSLLSAMARAGVFRLGGTVVGTHAFRLYSAELGRPLGSAVSFATDDVDIASSERLSLSLGDRAEPDVARTLWDLKFDAVPGLDAGRPAWRWRQTRGTTLVEFLTPSFEEDEGLRNLPALGVSAQAFHFLNYLIAGPIPAVGLYRSGVLVQVPKPERYAVHKMIVAARRPERLRLKARKDLLQAEALVEVMTEDRPFEIEAAFRDAWGRGPSWRQHLEISLSKSDILRDRLGVFRNG
jgi:hypothetical protein